MEMMVVAFWRSESGQGLPEYALLVAGVVVLVVSASAIFSGSVAQLFQSIGLYLSGNSP